MPEQFPACSLHQISEHVWWFTPESHTDRPSLCAVVGDEGVVLLDIGASPHHTHQFLTALSEKGIAEPDYAVLTHWHWDHVFGTAVINCPIIAYTETAENIKRMMSLDYSDDNLPNLVAAGHEVEFTREHMLIELNDAQRRNLLLREPEITFTQSMTLHLGNVTCELQHMGGDHASDSVVIHIPEDKVLFMGDCFYNTVYQEPQHYTAAKILPLIDKLKIFDADIFVLGHGNQLLEKAALETEFVLIRDAYRLLNQLRKNKIDSVKSELYQSYNPEDVDDYLQSIIAGFNLN